MKLKEKIDNNEKVQLVKTIWANKRYRSIFLLVLYFIFFFIVIAGLKSNYQKNEDLFNSQPKADQIEEFKAESILGKMEDMNNYTYRLLLNGEEVLNGKVEDSLNSFTYNNKDYVIMLNKLYLSKNDNLTKADLTKELGLPIEKLMIDDLIKELKSSEVTYKINEDNQFRIIYSVLQNYLDDKIEGNFEIKLSGENSALNKVEFNLSDYAKEKGISEDAYVITLELENGISD